MLTRAHVDRDDGRPAGHRAVGDRRAHRRAAGRRWASTRWPSWPRADHHELARQFGPSDRPSPASCSASGGDDAPVVDEPHVARSRSREVTFEHDLTVAGRDRATRSPGWPTEVTESVVAEGRRVTHVAVKVRTADVLHAHEDQQAGRADHRPGRGGPHGGRRARPVRAAPPGPAPRRACRARGTRATRSPSRGTELTERQTRRPARDPGVLARSA